MAWQTLPTDYTDVVWDGLKKYNQIDNSDGTVSFQDVTVYTNKEKSFFGAKDANRMNEALNYIMSMLENGTNLYEEFVTYFADQKQLFESAGDDVIEDVRARTNSQYDAYVTYLTSLKQQTDDSLTEIEKSYAQRMTSYESEQKSSFDTWFASIKGQLSEDAAGNLQNQTTELDERLSAIEHMVLKNDYTAPITIDSGNTLLVDDLSAAIVADWKYEEV